MVNHPLITWGSEAPAAASTAAVAARRRRVIARRAPFVARHYRVMRLLLGWLL